MGMKRKSGWYRFGLSVAAIVVVSLFTVAGAQARSWHWFGYPIVMTEAGLVQGFEDDSETLVWKAIPFAAAPVEDLRWQAPMSPRPWRGVRAETEFGDMCPQLDDGGVVGSEDCLYLNVWRPNSTDRDLPVFVWIHGGGNSIGSGAQAGYDGAYFAHRNNAVYISINYRLGPMGWFSHPALRTDEMECAEGDRSCAWKALAAAEDNSGNYGTLDMIKALKWVRKNIKAFGGDKDNVTIAGESAGAHNVLSMMLSPLAAGLFDKAIAMSAPNQPGIPTEIAELSANQTLARLLAKDGLAASEAEAYAVIAGMSKEEISVYLRSKTAAELIGTYDTIAFTMLAVPTILTDGTVIVKEGGQAFESGAYPNKVPTIIGSTLDEMKLFMGPFVESIEAGFAENFPGIFGPGEGYAIATRYNSAIWRAAGSDSIARAMVAQADQPDVFSYQFLWGANQQVVDPNMAFVFGAHHGRDVEFFLGTPGSVDAGFGIVMNTEANQPGRLALTDTIIDYLGNFMRTGNPNGDSLPEWPAWSNTIGEPKLITLDADLNDVITGISTEDLTEEGIIEKMNTNFGPEITEFILSFAII